MRNFQGLSIRILMEKIREVSKTFKKEALKSFTKKMS
jgi:hypothetical protein